MQVANTYFKTILGGWLSKHESEFSAYENAVNVCNQSCKPWWRQMDSRSWLPNLATSRAMFSEKS